MMRRIGWIVLLMLLAVWPAAAQQARSPLDWIPADFAGFVRLNMDDAQATLTRLNIALQAVTIIQPARFDQAIEPLDYEAYLPLGLLFDIEDPAFAQDIFPWLGGDVILAYRQFDAPLSADENDILMILPAEDAFLAAGRLNRIVEAQHFAERATYRGVTLYIGDTSTIAVTSQAVLVGPVELVRAALDLQAGEGEPLTAQPAYRAIQAQVPDDALIFGYLAGGNAGGVLSALLNGADNPDPLLQVAGEALRDVRGQNTLESRLLTGDVNGAGVFLKPGVLLPVTLEATVILHIENPPTGASTIEFDSSLLELIPRSAMIMQRGTDVRAAIYNLLVALPLSNFGGRMLAAFPVNETIGTRSGLVENPNVAEVSAAVTDFLATLEDVADFDLDADLLDYLAGSYAIALLPSPNRRVPVLNTPFDTLFIAKVEDGEAALAGISSLLETLTGIEEMPTETIGEDTFASVRLQGSGDVVLRMGVVDNTLIIATGDALDQVLAARSGDNRLIGESRWQQFTESDAPTPEWYVDINAVYNTFYPSAGAPTPGQGLFRGLAANSAYLGDGLYSVDLRVTLP
jgi:hypothetical protein